MAIDYTRLEKYLTREFRQYHLIAQVRRVIGVFLGVLGVQLATGWHDWTLKGLLALTAAVGYGTLRQITPTVPWKAFLGHVQVAQAVEAKQIADAAVAAAAAPMPSSAEVYTPVTPSDPAPLWMPAAAAEPETPAERPDPVPPKG